MESSETNMKRVKECISSIISKEESIIEFATAKLAICTPRTNKTFISFKKEGILCVISNRNYSCLFLQLFDMIEFTKVFEIELYTNIKEGYNAKDINFHTIEFPGFFLGISFAKPINNIESRGALIQKAIISTSKFLDINSEYYTYLFDFDHEKEKKSIQKKIEKLYDDNSSVNENQFEKERKDLESKLRNIQNKKNLFDSIEIIDSSDNKIYKMVSFHILKMKMKLVKKIYRKNFENFIGTKNIYYENIRVHKDNSYFFSNEEEEDLEEDMTKKKFVEYQPGDMIDMLDDDEGIVDERIQEIMRQRNNLKKIDKSSNEMKKTTTIKVPILKPK